MTTEEQRMRTPDRAAVEAAADAIIDAFAATDGDRYFAGFSPDATFIFHTEPERLADRSAYERIWAGWVESGWRVISCTSSEGLAQTFPGGAVFTHTVDTTVDTGDGTESYRERETIVFRVGGADDASDSRLTAIHEHLSPLPASADTPA